MKSRNISMKKRIKKAIEMLCIATILASGSNVVMNKNISMKKNVEQKYSITSEKQAEANNELSVWCSCFWVYSRGNKGLYSSLSERIKSELTKEISKNLYDSTENIDEQISKLEENYVKVVYKENATIEDIETMKNYVNSCKNTVVSIYNIVKVQSAKDDLSYLLKGKNATDQDKSEFLKRAEILSDFETRCNLDKSTYDDFLNQLDNIVNKYLVETPTETPIELSTVEPTTIPTVTPTTPTPVVEPTEFVIVESTTVPTATPATPTPVVEPTKFPTLEPTTIPTVTPATPTSVVEPTEVPTVEPTATSLPNQIDLKETNITLNKQEFYCAYKSTVKPSVTVKYNNIKLTKNQDYTVSYINNTIYGQGKVIITGIGEYKGTAEKTFLILPQKSNISSCKTCILGKQKVRKLRWKKQKGVEGYQIVYRYSKSGKYKEMKKEGDNTTSYVFISVKKKIYIKIRAYIGVNGKIKYGPYSSVKKVILK